VKSGLEKLADGLEDEYGMKYQWEGDSKATFSHKIAKGYVEIQGDEIVLELKLSMMYVAMSSVVKSKITEMADKHIS
jgi:putative polyhydroxyalkanoate system protein